MRTLLLFFTIKEQRDRIPKKSWLNHQLLYQHQETHITLLSYNQKDIRTNQGNLNIFRLSNRKISGSCNIHKEFLLIHFSTDFLPFFLLLISIRDFQKYFNIYKRNQNKKTSVKFVTLMVFIAFFRKITWLTTEYL